MPESSFCITDFNKSVVCTGEGAFDVEKVVESVDFEDKEGMNGATLASHATRHLFVFECSAWGLSIKHFVLVLKQKVVKREKREGGSAENQEFENIRNITHRNLSNYISFT